MEDQIKVGDVVRFKGGGSPMTVEQLDGGEAICAFSLGGTQRIKVALLEKALIPPGHHLWTDA